MVTTQNIYPGVLTYLGVQRELTAGVPLVPAYTQPVDQGSFEPEDTPKFLQDKAIRGAMTDLFYETLGVESATFSFGGPNFLDTHGFFMDNLFGDLSTTGSTQGTLYTQSAAVGPIGATSLTVTTAPSGFSNGTILQVGSAATAEVVIVTSTAASNVINFTNNPLRFAHTAGSIYATIPTTSQFTHKFASLNSNVGYGGFYGAQPPTHTFTDVSNIVNTYSSPTYGTVSTNTYGARMYPSGVLKSMDFSGNAEQIMGIKMAGDSWLSQIAGTAITNTNTNSRPIPNWNSTVNVLGTAITSIGEFSFSFKRQTQVYWTVQGTQTPLVIARGPLNVDGTINWDPTTTEQPLDMMLLNAQGPLVVTVSNTTPTVIPNSGSAFTMTFTCSQAANIKAKINRSKALLGYMNTFEGVANATDIGGSGGLGPGTITLINNIPTY